VYDFLLSVSTFAREDYWRGEMQEAGLCDRVEAVLEEWY
jgi:hypothetical protein